MSAGKTKALIIENNKQFVDEVAEALPGYIDYQHVRFSEAHDELAKGDVELVILNEGNDISFDIFSYISNDSALKKIPVVIVTKDAYSDNAFRYYDVGIPHFHEGVIDDTEFYMTVSDALDDMALYEDEMEAEEEAEEASVEKSSDKLMGMSISMSAPGRIAAYDDSTIKDKLSGIVSKTKKSVETTWDVIEAIAAEKEAAGEPFEIRVKHSRPSSPYKAHKDKWHKNGAGTQGFSPKGAKWGKAKEVQAPQQNIGGYAAMSSHIANIEGIENVHEIADRGKVSRLLDASQMSPQMTSQMVSQMPYQQVQQAQQVSTAPYIPKILIVDTDETTSKAFNLFLGSAFECAQVESSMKAIDYVVKNRIDVVITAQNVNGVAGETILNSIKNQPGGMQAKEMMLIEKNATPQDVQQILKMPGIKGVIRKPIVKRQLVTALNQAFR